MRRAYGLVNVGIFGIPGSAMPASSQQPARNAQAELRSIVTVDSPSNLGQFKSLRGLNSGPWPVD
jgi:hypothetical protein